MKAKYSFLKIIMVIAMVFAALPITGQATVEQVSEDTPVLAVKQLTEAEAPKTEPNAQTESGEGAPPTRGTTYVLKGLTASGSYYYSDVGGSFPDFDTRTGVWDGDAPQWWSEYIIYYTQFYTNPSETNVLLTRPVIGETYYFWLTVANEIALDDHSMDFSQVDASKVNVTLDGFNVAFLRADPPQISNSDGDYVRLHFRATYTGATKTITSVTITGVTEPVPGQHPAYTFNVSGEGVVQTSNSWGNTGAWWNMTDHKWMNDSDTFEAGKTYEFNAYVTAAEGYVWPDPLSSVSATMNGKTADCVDVGHKAVVCTFTCPNVAVYTVSFDANGHGTAPAAQTVEDGKPAAKPADPTESGWTFGGWYTEAACTNAFDFSTPITADITLYAKWTEESVTPVTHTVTFDGNGHGTPPAPVTVEHGNPVGCPADPVADPGWKFAGWCEDKEGTTAYQFSTPVTSDITIYASWTEDGGTPTTYTVSFNANSGSGTMLDIIVNGGEKLTLPECGFTPPTEDKEFDKWDAGNPGEQVDIISDCMITAIWRDKIAIYTVTVTNDSNGTASALPTSGPTGTNVVLTATPNGGYQFKEWQIVSGGVTITDNNFTIGTGNVEIKAIFEEATAEIMYAFTKGDGTSWTKSSGVALDFTVKGSPDDTNTFANFTGIQIDGATIASGNYTALAGSVDITLKPAFLETLSTSSHIIKAQFKDGDAEAMFTITETEPPVTVPPTAVPPVTAPPITPPPSDPGYDFKFTFTKAWQGDHEGSIDWVLYHPDGTVAHKKFNKKIISENEWRYEAWFPTATDYYIVETVPEGYKVRYENIGAHAGETDRCYNGGTIINYKIPKTGDTAPFLLWLSCIGLGLAAVSSGIFIGKRRKTRR